MRTSHLNHCPAPLMTTDDDLLLVARTRALSAKVPPPPTRSRNVRKWRRALAPLVSCRLREMSHLVGDGGGSWRCRELLIKKRR